MQFTISGKELYLLPNESRVVNENIAIRWPHLSTYTALFDDYNMVMPRNKGSCFIILKE